MKTHVTTLLLTATIAATLSLPAIAAPPAATITIECTHPSLPAQHLVAELIGSNNVTAGYEARERAMRDVRRACKDGATQVILVGEPTSAPPSRRTARAGWSR